MTFLTFGLLSFIYVLCVLFIGILLLKECHHYRFNFNILFTCLYLLTFYFGFPLTAILIFQYDVHNVDSMDLFYVLVIATLFYAIYYASYKILLKPSDMTASQMPASFTINRIESQLICLLLFTIASLAMVLFYLDNGLLLFKLTSYSQIFSKAVSNVSLKRFFYFFIPALLMIYFMRPNKRSWILFLLLGLVFGAFTYVLVGGTRANIIIVFALFFFIGIQQRYIKLWMLFIAGILGILGMFLLALKRYNLEMSSASYAFYSFLYLTRDTFSPWEAVARLLEQYERIELQGLMPIVRDFYVFIPQWLWPERPNLILNSANYYTWEVLQYHNGLAISPTLLGSLLIMGGLAFIPMGAVIIGGMIKGLDRLYQTAQRSKTIYTSAVIQTYCFANLFNMIVLIREGLDAFCSRFMFFSLIFGLCILIAKLIYWLFYSAKLIRARAITTKNQLP